MFELDWGKLIVIAIVLLYILNSIKILISSECPVKACFQFLSRCNPLTSSIIPVADEKFAKVPCRRNSRCFSHKTIVERREEQVTFSSVEVLLENRRD